MDFLELAKKRYSCRKFSDKKVSKEMLDQIIEAAVAAPTAKNNQPVKLWVFQSESSQETLHKITSCCYGASTFILVGGKKDDAWTRDCDLENFAAVDASIVATHIMMEAASLGLDSVWVGNFDAVKLKEAYPQLSDYTLTALFPIGYADDDPAGLPSPRHTLRKSIDDFVETL